MTVVELNLEKIFYNFTIDEKHKMKKFFNLKIYNMIFKHSDCSKDWDHNLKYLIIQK